MTDTTNSLRRCGLFRGFDDGRLNAIANAAEQITVISGLDIVREGEVGDAMYVILSGDAQVYTRSGDGREIALARLEAGEYFGEQALLPGGTGRRYASVRAVETVQLARIPKAVFQSVLAEDDALREHLVEIGEEQVRSYLQRLSPLARAIALNTVGRLRRNLSRGEILFSKGDEADALYFVNLGRLSVWREDEGVRTLVRYVERPGCVGEREFLTESRRSETVIAEDYAEVTGVVRAAFDEVYAESSSVREYVATLQRCYDLPQRGILTQHHGTFAGHECLTTLYHLNDGRIVAAYRGVGQALYAVECLGAEVSETLSWQDSGQSRDLRIDANGTLIGLTVRGEWPDIHNYHLLVLDGGRIDLGQQKQFTRTGSFDLTPVAGAADTACHCLQVSADTLRTAIQQGATTFTQLQERTGCGTVCGGCVPVITEMLGTEEWVLADVVAVHDEAPGIRSFELVSRDASYPEAAPGQHIVVEGLIGGLRVRRPYTLSSPPQHQGRLRITVKLESGGAFSPWLFDHRPTGEPLRITRPRGDYVIDLTEGPAVCFVAGIGVTPALAAARSISSETRTNGRQLVIHYSGRSRDQMAGLKELESAAQRSSIELIIRETARQGRLNAAEVAQLVARFPTADWYLCGPESYRREIREWLKQAHVAGDRIHTETFTSIGPPDATHEEREAFTRYVLVQPRPAPAKPFRRTLRRTGKILHSFANTRINPLRGVEKRLARMTGLDPSLPLEHCAVISALSWGPHDYQLQAFSRLKAGDTFTYWMPTPRMPKYPSAYRVDTGWTKIAERRLVPVYVTRSRSAIEYLLRRSDDTDRGPLPYHYFQQVLGRPDIPSCPGRKAAGLFAGQLHDNATWIEDRALASDAFGFQTIDLFGPGMSVAADQTCASIDAVVAREPNALIDLNVMLSKVAYTIIVLAVFGNVDLVEMHALGRTLSESIRKQLGYLWEFVMGRQSVPADYSQVLESGRLGIRRIIDLLRELDQRGKLTESQRSAPVVRMVLETADEPDGAYDRLTTLVLPLIIGGHETTGHAMTWAFYEMARNAELEADVLAEIETFRAAHGARPISTADYDERPMAWALLAECLRRYTPLSSLSRTTLRDGTVPPDPKTGTGGFYFPAGAMIVFSLIGIHFDPARWNDPYAFQPKRWFEGVRDGMPLQEQGRTVRANIRAREQALDWLPFSDGPGRCPGQHFNAHEFFVLLDALLPRYRFELANPKEEVPPDETLIVGPAQGRMAVRIRHRS